MAIDRPFYFLRHGETEWNKIGRTQGQLDSQLNETGRAQAARAAEALAGEPIERIIASPLSRALHTAEATAAKHGITVETDDALMECHLGDHQGGPHGPFLPAFFRGEYDPPGGETFTEFCERVWGAMQRAVARGPNTLIVAHGGLWIAARQYVSMTPDLDRMPNALPLHVVPDGGAWQHRICGRVEVADAPSSY